MCSFGSTYINLLFWVYKRIGMEYFIIWYFVLSTLQSLCKHSLIRDLRRRSKLKKNKQKKTNCSQPFLVVSFVGTTKAKTLKCLFSYFLKLILNFLLDYAPLNSSDTMNRKPKQSTKHSFMMLPLNMLPLKILRSSLICRVDEPWLKSVIIDC